MVEQSLIKQAAVAARQLLGGAVDIFVQLCILVIATFFLMSEGHRLVDYVVDLAPLSEERTRGMLERLRRVTAAVFSSTILTALLQTLVALVGYLIADIPAKTLVLFATLVFAFIPAIGAATITTGAGILLWMSGSVGMGIFLTAWGLVVVGLIDNVVKPLLAKNAIHLPGSLVFFAMICGLTVFGVMGIVAGPLIVAFFQVIAATLRDAQAVNPTNGVPTSS